LPAVWNRSRAWRGWATNPPLLTPQIKFMTLNLDYPIAKAKRVLALSRASIFVKEYEAL
jgi:hypothetical protein